jgi:membrane protein DedA with SNARE-associated domain
VVDRIVEFLRPYLSAPWGYFIVGAATFMENSVGAGVIVPGETLVIIGGFYARIGDLWLPWVIVAACLGAVLGDNVGYLIGRRYGRGFLERHGRRLFVTADRLARADAYYRRHGGKTVFLGRFIPVVRSVGCILAGIAHMPWRRFLVYDLAGAIVWGTGHSILGYAIGASYERWKKYLTPGGLVVFVLLLLLVGGARLLAQRRAERTALLAEGDPDPDPPEDGAGLEGPDGTPDPSPDQASR